MDININKNKVCLSRLVATKKEVFFVEENIIVPDVKPDFLNAVNSSANVCIYKKDVQNERIKLDGCINSNIMYIPDSQNENLRGLNANIDFSKIFDLPECKENMISQVDINVKDFESKALNGRKINLRVGLEVIIKVYSNEDVEIIDDVNNLNDIQVLEKEISLNSLIGIGNARVYVKDTINLGEDVSFMEILSTEISLINNDIKISYNKVISKCDVELKIIYLTSEGDVKSVISNIPAVGFMDIQNVSEDSICDVKYEYRNILVKQNSPEDHSIYVEIELDSMCMAYEDKKIKYIQDLYSPTVDLELGERNICTTNSRTAINKIFTISSKTNIADIKDGNLLDTKVTIDVDKEQIKNTKIYYEGNLIVNFIYKNENNLVNNKISKIPFEFSVDNPEKYEYIRIDTNSLINNKNFKVNSNGDIDCSIDIEFNLKIFRNIEFNLIDTINIIESEDSFEEYNNLIMYLVNPGDTLWKIAKMFKTTVEEVKYLNEIDDENKIFVGQKLYISKYVHNM